MSFSHSVMDTHNFLHDLGSPNCHTLTEVAHSQSLQACYVSHNIHVEAALNLSELPCPAESKEQRFLSTAFRDSVDEYR